MDERQAASALPGNAGKVWSVDADVTLQSLLDDPTCPMLLRRALTGTLSWQTRNVTEVREALGTVRIAPGWVTALLALGAVVRVEGTEGSTGVPLERFLEERPDGIMTALEIPLGDTGRRWGEASVARTPTDEPIVAAVAVVDMDGPTVRQARIALSGVWLERVRLAVAAARLVGSSLDKSTIAAVAEAVEAEVAPKGDYLGSAEYRRAMAGVLARRALDVCLQGEAGDE